MRAFAAVVAMVASIALAGCSSSQPNSPVDPEEAEPVDYRALSIVFGIVAIAILGLVAVLLLVRRKRDAASSDAALPSPRKKDNGP